MHIHMPGSNLTLRLEPFQQCSPAAEALVAGDIQHTQLLQCSKCCHTLIRHSPAARQQQLPQLSSRAPTSNS